MGAGTTYAPDATGGVATVVLTEAQMPAHSHTVTGTTSNSGTHTQGGVALPHATDAGRDGDSGSSVTGLLESNRYGATTGAGGDHLHTLTATAASTGGGAAHDNIPPYYALAYIMKS